MKALKIMGLASAALLVASPARAITLDGNPNIVCMTFGGLNSCASVTVTLAPSGFLTALVRNNGGTPLAAEYLLSAFGFFKSGETTSTTLTLTGVVGNPAGWADMAPADGLVNGLPSGYVWLTRGDGGIGTEGAAEAGPSYRLDSGESVTLKFDLAPDGGLTSSTAGIYFAFRGQAYGSDNQGSFRCYEGLGGTASAIGVTGTPVCGSTVVPEPGSMALLATGLVGLVGAGLVKRRKIS